MDSNGFKFVRFFTIDLLEVEIYKNDIGQYKTICTFIDCDDIGKEEFFPDFEHLYDIYSDYIDRNEIEFDPCVIMLRRFYGPN